MATANSLQRVSVSDLSVHCSGDCNLIGPNNDIKGAQLGANSLPGNISLTFHGTQAGVFGQVPGFPFQVSIAGPAESSELIPPPPLLDNEMQQSFFYITDILPCNKYNFTVYVNPGHSMQINHFGVMPCSTSGGGSQSTATMASTSSSATISNTSALAASTSTKPLSAGLTAGLVISSLLLFLMLCGVVLLLFTRRRRGRPQKRPSSGPSSWSRLPGSGDKVERSPSSQVLLSVPTRGEDYKQSRFDSYMFKPSTSAAAMREPSLQVIEQQPPGLAAAALPPPHVCADASTEKPPQYADDDWTADPESHAGGVVVRGYLPDSKEWIAREQREQESSESSTVPTNHAVEFVPRYQDRERSC